MSFDLSHFERLAVYSAHMRSADSFDKFAALARARACRMDFGWQGYAKQAIRCERNARKHRERAKEFKP